MLTAHEQAELLGLLSEEERYQAGRKLWSYYPDNGPLRRALYPKHMQFFEAGLKHRERAVIAANRVGKTEGCGGYETSLHLTGIYPEWWPGRRFEKPVDVLCGGDTATTTRDILVLKMLGPKENRGTGLVPRETLIGRPTPAPGIPDHVDLARIKHASGGVSRLQFRSYDQGRLAWQGTERDIVWMDEEPPQEIYTEALTRTMTTGGMLIITATPLSGLTDVVLSFLPDLAPAA